MSMRWLTVMLAAALVACGAAQPAGTRLTVLAAASLTEFMREAADEFSATHPAVVVTVELAGSQQLARQLLDGARADVFASADERWMDRVRAAGLVARDPVVFAANRMQIAVSPGNPRDVTDLRDLVRRDVTTVMAAPSVPAGAYAAELLRRAGVELNPASLEPDVRAALARVSMGEADAAIVYASDVVAAGGRVEGVPIDSAPQMAVRYPVAVLEAAANPQDAEAFVASLLKADRLRAAHGLLDP